MDEFEERRRVVYLRKETENWSDEVKQLLESFDIEVVSSTKWILPTEGWENTRCLCELQDIHIWSANIQIRIGNHDGSYNIVIQKRNKRGKFIDLI